MDAIPGNELYAVFETLGDGDGYAVFHFKGVFSTLEKALNYAETTNRYSFELGVDDLSDYRGILPECLRTKSNIYVGLRTDCYVCLRYDCVGETIIEKIAVDAGM